MSFCCICGQHLESNANFCSGCGTRIAKDQGSARNAVFSGEIHKCPSCGAVLKAYEAVCESCGYEIRGGGVSDYARQFSEQLKNATNEYQKASIIQSFPVPNNREDIFNFLIAASSNIHTYQDQAILAAWTTKIEESYQKAKLVLRQKQDLAWVEETYTEAKKKIEAVEMKKGITKQKTEVKSKPETAKTPSDQLQAKSGERSDSNLNSGTQSTDKRCDGGASTDKKTTDEFPPYLTIVMIALVLVVLLTLGIAAPALDLSRMESQMLQICAPAEETDGNCLQTNDIYTCGYDKDKIYVATVVSPTVLKLEQWILDPSVDDEQYYLEQYQMGAYDITDAANEFGWLGGNNAAFKLTVTDDHESGYKTGKSIIFTILFSDYDYYENYNFYDSIEYYFGDSYNMGTNRVAEELSYEYQYDDHRLYVAVPLAEHLMKFECWERGSTEEQFRYSYDVYTVDTRNEFADYSELEGYHQSFVVKLIDTKNQQMKKPVFVIFEKVICNGWG